VRGCVRRLSPCLRSPVKFDRPDIDACSFLAIASRARNGHFGSIILD
jgi:hypothetical protein